MYILHTPSLKYPTLLNLPYPIPIFLFILHFSFALEPENSLKREISEILLNFAAPDSYMRCLLTILRTSDRLYLTSDPLLSRYFSKADYEKKVKERVDVISNSWTY